MALHQAIQRVLLIGVHLEPLARTPTPSPPAALTPLIEAIAPCHRAFDERAIDYGHRYRSGFWAIYLLSAIAVLFAVLPLALGWDSPGHRLHSYAALWASGEVLVIGTVFAIYWWGHSGRWHGWWLEARTTAELTWYLPMLAPLLDLTTPAAEANWYLRVFDPGQPVRAADDEVAAQCARSEPLARKLLVNAWSDPEFIAGYARWTIEILGRRGRAAQGLDPARHRAHSRRAQGLVSTRAAASLAPRLSVPQHPYRTGVWCARDPHPGDWSIGRHRGRHLQGAGPAGRHGAAALPLQPDGGRGHAAGSRGRRPQPHPGRPRRSGIDRAALARGRRASADRHRDQQRGHLFASPAARDRLRGLDRGVAAHARDQPLGSRTPFLLRGAHDGGAGARPDRRHLLAGRLSGRARCARVCREQGWPERPQPVSRQGARAEGRLRVRRRSGLGLDGESRPLRTRPGSARRPAARPRRDARGGRAGGELPCARRAGEHDGRDTRRERGLVPAKLRRGAGRAAPSQIGCSIDFASGVKVFGPDSVMYQQSSRRTPNSPGI